jgi:hypothetical protein
MTERDQFIQAQVQGMLAPGEQIVNMAYVLKAPGILMQMLLSMICYWLYYFQVKHYYAALTNQRLILIKTRSGFFSPKIVNEGIEEYALASVASVSTGGFLNNRSMALDMKDQTKLSLRIAPWAKLCQGQGKWMDDVQNSARALGAGVA